MTVQLSTATSQPTFYSITGKYLQKEKGVKNLILKPAVKAISWAQFAQVPLSPQAIELKQLSKKTTLLFSILERPGKIIKIFTNISTVAESLCYGNFGQALKKTKDVFAGVVATLGLISDGVETASAIGWFTLSARTQRIIDVIGFWGSVSLVINSLFWMKKPLIRLFANEVGSPLFNLSLMSLAKDVLYLALGVMGMLTFSTPSLAIPSVVFLSFSTATLLLSIVSHYYKEIHQIQLPKKD